MPRIGTVVSDKSHSGYFPIENLIVCVMMKTWASLILYTYSSLMLEVLA